MFKKKRKALGKVKEEGNLSNLYLFNYQQYTHILLVTKDRATQLERHFHHKVIYAADVDGYFLGGYYRDYCQIYIYLIDDNNNIAPLKNIEDCFGKEFTHLPVFLITHEMIRLKDYHYVMEA